MNVQVARHGDAETFLKRARSWLLQTEPEHNLILGLAERPHSSHGPYVATVEQNGTVVGCALRTPPRKLVITRIPPGAVDALVMDVTACYDELPGVFGPPVAAREFARQWCARHGSAPRDAMTQRLYSLDRVRTPQRIPGGSLRLARPEQAGLVSAWISCFAAEAGVEARSREHVAACIAAGEMALWWDGEPRTLAGYSGRSPNGVRIGYVYTPPEWRGRGYATACVAALSQHALDGGARFCCLYTDLSNPASNRIYQRIGYTAVCDVVDIEFDTLA